MKEVGTSQQVGFSVSSFLHCLQPGVGQLTLGLSFPMCLMGELTWVTSDTLKPSHSTEQSAPGRTELLEHSMPLHLELSAMIVLCMELALQNCV